MKKGAVLCVLISVCALAAFSLANDAPSGKKILVVLDDLKLKTSHSQYFQFLESSGYTVDYLSADDRNLKIRKYGEWLYDHLIFFAPTVSDIAGVTSEDILQFIDAGRNVIIAAESDLGDIVREVASDCNVEFDDAGTNVIDHFIFNQSDIAGDHTLLVSDSYAKASIVFKDVTAPILFRGIAQDIEEDSLLLFPLVSASNTAYSATVDEPVKELFVAGKKTVLVSALQARNNARVIFSGSIDLFSDKFFSSPVSKVGADGKVQRFEKSGNEQFAKQVTQWALQEKGVIRAKNPVHHLVGETAPPPFYTIKQDVQYSIEIEEWDGQKWTPYVAPDVQLEFRMIDPYVRITLKTDGKGKFFNTFKLPDVYGVFTFKVEYTRQGYSFVNSIVREPVRPVRHNEYERFIDSAFPYYASALSMMAGLFVFSWVFLFHKEK